MISIRINSRQNLYVFPTVTVDDDPARIFYFAAFFGASAATLVLLTWRAMRNGVNLAGKRCQIGYFSRNLLPAVSCVCRSTLFLDAVFFL